jgi:outer membrane protein assembly factor BamB
LAGALNRHREPHLLFDAERVYVAHGDGVTALDVATGQPLWHSKGPGDRLLLSGDLLLAAECGSGEDVRRLTARATKTGAEVFKVRLSTQDFDALPLREIAGLFLVQRHESPDGQGEALLLDRQGQVRHRLDREVVDGRPQDGGLVLLTSKDVLCLSPDGKTLWSVAFEKREWPAGGGLVELPGGDVAAFLYGSISDSGVQVVRVDPCRGKVAWRASCAPLGVDHSKYRHEAALRVEDGQVIVSSRGSAGKFVEWLDLRTGRRLKRD